MDFIVMTTEEFRIARSNLFKKFNTIPRIDKFYNDFCWASNELCKALNALSNSVIVFDEFDDEILI